jgi:predicted glycogen debranching enzyme
MTYILPQLVHLERDVCGNLEQAEQREWWLANGLGGYAGGTVAGTLTRRYHGMLIAPLHGALQRHLLFAKVDAELLDGDQVIPLHTNRWGSGVIEPRGHLNMESFHLDGRMPVWRYSLDGLLIEARIWMEFGKLSTYIAWRLLANPDDREVRLRARLLVNVRDHHGITQLEECTPEISSHENALDVRQGDLYTLHFNSRCGHVEPANFWVMNFDLPRERERGLPDRDSHLCIGHITFPLYTGHWVGMVASLAEGASPYLIDAMQRFQNHEELLLTQAKNLVPELTDVPRWINQLVMAADSFVVDIAINDTQERTAIIAGYPWFGEWGRDTMISLPGLLLATGRYAQARRLLNSYLPLVNCGMLPNYFPGDNDTPQYNTVDAALWYIEAWRAYLEFHNERQLLTDAWPKLQEIIQYYRDGTRYNIKMDEADGLIYAGEAGVQLTWMDAKVGDTVITPRIGKPVEVNALWYNALMAMAQFAQCLGHQETAANYKEMAEYTKNGFQRFINTGHSGLYDVLDCPDDKLSPDNKYGPEGNDDRIRPNQIFAVSLHFSPLDASAQCSVVEVCASHLLTSFGLRTLAPDHADYRPYYEGDVWARDSAYHQGTVWAWLLGHYALAEYRVSGDANQALLRLEPMQDHLGDAGLGTISEIFDGEAPHTPRGCPAQAWSVACTLEAWWKLQYALRTNNQGEKINECC